MAKTRSLPVHAPDSSRRMGRRQAVRALVAGAGAGVAIPGLAAGPWPSTRITPSASPTPRSRRRSRPVRRGSSTSTPSP
jgi:hypothetical protein